MKKQKTYDRIGRAKRVLVSQGKAPSLADSSMSQYVDRLAALCSETGVLVGGAPAQFQRIWFEHVDELNKQKATCAGTEDGLDG